MEVRLHETQHDLRQILHLQKQNHKNHISTQQAEKEGYVTVRHNFYTLSRICGHEGHVITVNEKRVIGYALTMHSFYARKIPVLNEMVGHIKSIEGTHDFLIMGQLCVAIEWRGKGLVGKMYDFMRNTFKSQYPGIYTEVASDNPRSLRAHEKCDYKIVKIYKNKLGKEWKLLYCDWSS